MEDLYKKYYFGLKKFISQKIDDEGVVEELINDVMLAVMNSEKNYQHRCCQFSWICSIAKHKIIDYYRKKKIKTILFSVNPIFEEIADKALTPERDVLKNELKDEIKKTLSELKEGYRNLLRLKYVENKKITEIAKESNLSVKAIESRLIRAKKQFKEAWVYDQKKN